MKTDIKVIPYASPEWRTAVALRENVLRVPLGQRFTEQELHEERDHIQIAAFSGAAIVATCVLVPEKPRVKVQRVAVEEHLRNKNIGADLMHFCEELIREQGFGEIYCHARDTAIPFYAKIGYQGEGDPFDEDGIPHLKMTKKL